MTEFHRALARALEQDECLEGEFSGVTAEEVNAVRAELRKCLLKDCKFTKCDFSRASFSESRLEDCLFHECRFSDGYFRNVEMLRCRFEGTDFRRVHLRDCILTETSLRYANFCEGVWERVGLNECSLKDASLSVMRLVRPVFHEVDLSGADFFRNAASGRGLVRMHDRGNCRIGELRGAERGQDQRASGNRAGAPSGREYCVKEANYEALQTDRAGRAGADPGRRLFGFSSKTA